MVGSLNFQSPEGAFGGSGLTPQPLVPGASRDPLTFDANVDGTTVPATVTGSYSVLASNGTSSTVSVPVLWAPGEVIKGLTLTLQLARPSTGLTVKSPPGLPGAKVGQSYTFSFAALGGLSPYTWSATSSPPPGLSLKPDGTLSGIPFAIRPLFLHGGCPTPPASPPRKRRP